MDYKPGDEVNLKVTTGEVPEVGIIKKEEENMPSNEELAKSVAESNKATQESMEGVKKLIEDLNKKKEAKMPEGQPATPSYNPKEVADIVESVLDQRAKRDEEQRRFTAEQKKAQQDLIEDTVEKVIEKRFCTSDGAMCFATKEELDIALSKGFSDVQENIKKILEEKKEEEPKEEKPKEEPKVKPEPKPTVEEKVAMGIQPLTPMGRNPEAARKKRAAMSEEELEKRDAQVKNVVDKTNITYQDLWRIIKKDPVELATIKKKAAEDMDLQQKLDACDLGDPEACKEAAESLQKKGLTIFKIDEKKKTWSPVDEKIKPKATFLGG